MNILKTPRGEHYLYVRDRSSRYDLPWVRPADFVRLQPARPVVLVNGAFDLLHSGHMKVIYHARELAKFKGTVVCAMDSDRKVREAKGDWRPVLTYPERAAAMEYMPVDYLVEIDTEEDMCELVKCLKPDMRVQGGEYKTKDTRFPGVKKVFVEVRGMSTSKIIRRTRKGYRRRYKADNE